MVETRDAGGAAHRTHVWFVEAEGELWLEAGTPEYPWADTSRSVAVRLLPDGAG